MPDDRNRIYRCDFVNKGKNYRLDIIPAFGDVLAEVEDPITHAMAIPIVKLTYNAFDVINDLNSKFQEKIPLGLVAADDLKIVADLSFMPKELIGYMLNPFYNTSASIDYTIPNGEGTTDITPMPLSIDLANVFILKKETSTNVFETLMVGTPKKTTERKITSGVDFTTMEFDLIDISKTLYSLVTSELISNSLLKNGIEGNISTIYNDQYIDTQYYDDSLHSVVYFNHYNHNATSPALGIWFYHADLHEQIDIIAAQIYAKYLRVASTEISITHQNNPFIALQLYKQNCSDKNTPGEVGDDLTYEELLFFGAGQNKYYDDNTLAFLPENCTSGFLINGKDNKNNIHEHKTAWDFYKELSKTNLCKLTIEFTSEYVININWLRLLEIDSNHIFLSVPDYYNTEGNNLSITDSYNVINGVKCSMTDSMPANPEEYSVSKDGSKADPEEEYKSLFHTVPTAFETEKYKTEKRLTNDPIWGAFEPVYQLIVDIENPFIQFCNGKIYYYDADSWSNKKISGCAAGNIIKAHANVSIDDVNTVTDYVSAPINSNTFTWGSTSYNDQYLGFVISRNSELNKCTFLASFFGNYTQALWEIECPQTNSLTQKNIGDTIVAPEITQGQIDLLIGTEATQEDPAVPGINPALGYLLQLFFTVGAYTRTYTILDVTTDIEKETTKAKIFIKGL